MKLRKPYRRASYRPPEGELIIRVVALFRDAGYRINREVPNMGQCVDIVASSRRYLVAIEAKRADWRRALNQCRAHRAVADFICVAIGTQRISTKLQEAAERLEYGLIHCPPDATHCVWITRPRRNRRVWPPQRECFKHRLTEIENGN